MHIRLIPNEIIKATGGRFAGGIGLTMIEAVCIDSRKATPGSLFVPLKGAHQDGHRFIEDALKKGAVATLVAQSSGMLPGLKKKYSRKILIEVDDPLTALGDLASFWRYKFSPTVVVIIGSSGAFETREITWNIIKHHFGVLKNPYTTNNLKGLPLCLMDLNAGHEVVLLALDTDSPGEIKRLVEISNPTVGLTTHVHKTVHRKVAELLQHLQKTDMAILNSDDPQSIGFEKTTQAHVLTFGLKKGNIRASNIRQFKDGRLTFALHLMKQTTEVKMALPGVSHVSSALGAAATASMLQIEIEDIKRGLESFEK
jgi:UDP-N-acetylmuramoyl-tripeptide--D-alanyl-D-alanine ligase